MITVLVADDEPVVRVGISAILDAEPDIEVAGQAADGRAAVEAVLALRPTVAIVDIRMPGTDGLAATAHITAAAPATKVIVLTTFGQDDHVFAALRAGAEGFLLKDAPPTRIIDAVRAVARGDAMIDPGVTRLLIDRRAARPPGLTPREIDVLTHVASGLSNVEIAGVLGLSPATVKDHVAALLGKLGVRNRVQAAVAAYDLGFVRPR
ncbi:DNA-binding NarL/FixJ family response regulator [Actinocrispum wychmicini]|uniref:DNA-binding NarL/FixJ family response regulator n=1 Tax=Actinocrispum wychmicini TaxID=1213861 RepID=A0A4V2S608_9PSEU|nr:DNA-binding NarL/FixJ family response regulator [Actinocrispum wychmicini]